MSEKSKTLSLINDAIRYSRIEILKQLLLQKRVNINIPGPNTMSLLHVAAKHGNPRAIELLIKKGAIIDSTFDGTKKCRFTPLHLAVQQNNLECVILLLELGASVSSKIKGVCHPIHFAVFNDNFSVTEILLSRGANVNLRFFNEFHKEFEKNLDRSLWSNHNLPLLHYSILRKFEWLTNLLLRFGADVNLKTILGKTVLMQAVEVNDWDFVKDLIINRQANVNARDVFGKPVLHYTMIDSNKKVWICTQVGRNDLISCEFKLQILRLLISCGADVNARFPINQENTSVIHYMIKYGFSSGVEYLLYNSNFNFDKIDLITVRSARISDQDIPLDIKNNVNKMQLLKEGFKKVVGILVAKAISLQMIGLPVNKDVILKAPIHDSISLDQWKKNIDSYKNYINDQINYMKATKIGDSNITVWHLLTCGMDKLIKLTSKLPAKDFKITEDYSQSKMYFYCQVLKNRLLYAKERKSLLKKSTEFVFNLLAHRLPYDCCEEIVKYLSNQELKFLC